MTIDKLCPERRLADHSEAAIRFMREYEIEPNPNNYRIWFTYASGQDKKLCRTINILRSNKRELNSSICEDIYYRFFQSTDEATQLTSVTSTIKTQLNLLASNLSKAGIETSQFGDMLEGTAMSLGNPHNSLPEERLKPVIHLLLSATQKMQERNQNLQQHLQRSGEQISDLHATIETIRTISETDQLTEIGNRRSFDDHLREYAMQSMETGEPFCLLFLDIDKFKNFNDEWGHSLGDQVLRLFASCMQKTVGDKGFCARYGGEEFAVLLPNMDIPEALNVANAIRETIASREIVRRSDGQKIGAITVSAGLALFEKGEPLTSFIERADSGLYAAKQNGRNRVVCENELLRLKQDADAGAQDFPVLKNSLGGS